MRSLTESFIDFEESRLMEMGGIRLKDGITFAKPTYTGSEDFYVLWIEAKRFHQECLSSRGAYPYREVLNNPFEYSDPNHETYVYRTNLSPSRAITMPEIRYSASLGFSFINGIHRTLTWMNAGANYIPFEMDRYSYEQILATNIPVLKAMKSSDVPMLLSATSKLVDSHYCTNPNTAAFMTFFPSPVPIQYEIKVWEELSCVLEYERVCLERFLEKTQDLGQEDIDSETELLLHRVKALGLMRDHTLRGYKILLERGFLEMPGDEEKDPRTGLHKLNTDRSTEDDIAEIGKAWSEYAIQRDHPQKLVTSNKVGFENK